MPLLEMRNIVKEFPGVRALDGVSFTLDAGEFHSLVGENGAGKSTLIKLLAGTEPLSAGTMKLGHNVEPDYFAQDQYKELDPNGRMIDDLGMVAPRATNTELRTILGSFLFSEDDVFKTIGVLSGGERNRYALARMLMMPSNFLLLDEPTNHLDMRAKDVLLRALGTQPEVEVDIEQVGLFPNDVLLLCSDGLTRMVTEPEIAGALQSEPDPQKAAEKLIRLANEGGGVDNVTAIVVSLKPEAKGWFSWLRRGAHKSAGGNGSAGGQ